MLSDIMGEKSKIINDPSSINEHLNYYIQNTIGNGTPIEQLKNLCLLLIFTFILKNILFYLSTIIIQYIQNKAITKIRIKLFEHISSLSLSFFNNTKSAELLSILIKDISGMRYAFSQSLQKLIVEPFSILSFIILLFIINFKFALLVLIIIPSCGIFSYKVGQSIRRKSKRNTIQSAGILNVAKETFSNIKILKIFNAEKEENLKFKKENDKYFNLLLRHAKLDAFLTPINELIGLFLGVLLIWFGGLNVLVEQTMSSEDFIKFILLLFAMMQPIRKLAIVNVSLQTGIASAQRVFDIFDTKEKIIEKENPIEIFNFKSSIEFQNVDFKFSNTENKVLKKINTTINKGQTVAIVGKSGAGKSTFSDLIPRFYEPTNGQILIDNHNINQYKLKHLRELIGIVTQNIALFNDTIENNIKYGNKKATNEEVLNAVKSANISDLINDLPNGLNTVVGENGIRLSGGEKQRISIARALIKNPEILILDEATASLDSESEKNVHKAIDNIIKNRTVIIIAHRLSTILNADKIIVIEKGEIIEEGRHTELLKNGKIYKNLYDNQFTQTKT
tara:strand:- start:4308 stop:5999 length:1692 start_codon:yes stop_codon:yes gene_type:complete